MSNAAKVAFVAHRITSQDIEMLGGNDKQNWLFETAYYGDIPVASVARRGVVSNKDLPKRYRVTMTKGSDKFETRVQFDCWTETSARMQIAKRFNEMNGL